MPHHPHCSWSVHLKNIWWVQIIRLSLNSLLLSLLSRPSLAQISYSAPYSRTPSAYVSPPMSATKFEKYLFIYLFIYLYSIYYNQNQTIHNYSFWDVWNKVLRRRISVLLIQKCLTEEAHFSCNRRLHVELYSYNQQSIITIERKLMYIYSTRSWLRAST
jgi:hypothetical protein